MRLKPATKQAPASFVGACQDRDDTTQCPVKDTPLRRITGKEDYIYKQGDTVSHAYHGIGTIKSVGEREVLGTKLKLTTLYFPHEGLRLSLRRDDLEDQVREILTEEEAHEIINYLAGFDEKLAKNWKRRNANNKERLTSGDPREVCQVAKGLMRLKKQRKKPLSNSDRRQLQKAFRLLAEELGRVLDEEAEVMEDKLREACRDSLAA